MAVLAPKTSLPSSMGGLGHAQAPSTMPYTAGLSSHRTPVMGATTNGPFASPTESEFSEAFDRPDSVRYEIQIDLQNPSLRMIEVMLTNFHSNWDEKRVGEWLRSINCAQYEQLFRCKLALCSTRAFYAERVFIPQVHTSATTCSLSHFLSHTLSHLNCEPCTT